MGLRRIPTRRQNSPLSSIRERGKEGKEKREEWGASPKGEARRRAPESSKPSINRPEGKN